MERMIREFTQNWAYFTVIVLLLVLVASLLGQLGEARRNEIEMSRRVYQAVRQGYMLPPPTNTTYEKK